MSVRTALPVADSRSLRRYVRGLARRHPRMLWSALALHIGAALAGLAAPRLLGDLVQSVDEGTTVGHVDQVVLALAVFLVVQTVLTRYARLTSQVLGEQVLARALASAPEILVLVEPTSAVDAHTEARIAARLRGHRAGQTTVVVSSSPLVLDAVDEVAFLRDGLVVATGTHAELLATRPDYRAVVTRESEPAEVPT